MDVDIFQKNRHDPLRVTKLVKIEFYSVVEDEKQIIEKDFSSFSLNGVVSEVNFVGKTDTVTIRPGVIESLHFFPHDEFDDLA
ncbi:hypothetical protein AB0X64_05080 [Limosilactobacillus vaginalis]|uniref:hypothetical protein n=1 Tax=Limosilactobacillus vaginalis TaxID=1633 RepID=UPI003F1F004D